MSPQGIKIINKTYHRMQEAYDVRATNKSDFTASFLFSEIHPV